MTHNCFQQPLIQGNYYHIYNRANSRERLFHFDDNYFYFLHKYASYLANYVDTFAYCLLPNHFHLFVRLKQTISSPDESPITASNQFRKFFITYSQAINKQQNRTGSLFQKPFRRVPVENETHFHALIFYIHANCQKHNPAVDFRHYPFSSYQTYLSDKPTLLKRDEILDMFDGREAFIRFHEDMKNCRLDGDLRME